MTIRWIDHVERSACPKDYENVIRHWSYPTSRTTPKSHAPGRPGRSCPSLKYTTLVDELFESFDRAIFLTLNYDLLLDQVLSALYWGGEFHDMASYIRDRWALVKLHGSVSWGRKLDLSDEPDPPSFPSNANKGHLVGAFNDWPPKGKLSREISVLKSFDRFWTNGPHYPALALPVAGKYEYVCPEEHVSALKERLPLCDTVLVIGASGKDRDLLDVLEANLDQVTHFAVVGDGSDTAEASTNFLQVPQLSAVGSQMHTKGFSSFVQTGGLETLRESAQQHV